MIPLAKQRNHAINRTVLQIKTTRRTGGLKKPYKGLILTLPLKGLRKVCQLHFILSYPLRGYFFLHFSPVNGSTDSKSVN